MTGGLRDRSRYSLAGVSALAVLAMGTPVDAQDNQAIQAQIKALQSQINSLQRQVEQANVAAAAAQKSSGDDLDLKVKWRGAPEFSSADGNFKMKLRGRLHADWNSINQDESITGRPNVDAFEIRRARLGIEGVVWGDVKYIVEADFANDAVSLKDAYLEYTGLFEDFGLRFGNFKTFNSFDQLNSSNYRTFQETPSFVEADTIDRQIGAAALYTKKHYTLAAGIFGPTTATEERWLDDIRTGSARITLAPINEEGKVIHAGASWRSRKGATDLRAGPINTATNQFFQYRARGADLHLADRFISTPAVFDEDTFWGLEGLLIYKWLHVVGEYTQLKADVSPFFSTTSPDPNYDGWYIETGFWLTGETTTYNEGVYGRPKVKNPVFNGGYGAWQLVGRYDVLDLTDKALGIPNTAGFIPGGTLLGEQKTWLVGVNWWLNNHTRFQFQYSESDIGGGFLNGANLNDGAKIKGFGARAQVDW